MSQAIVYSGPEKSAVCGILLTEGKPVSGPPEAPSSNPCDQWQLTDSPVKGDWAIVQTAVRIVDIDETDAGGEYEMWGYLEAKVGEYVLARHQFGTAEKDSTHKLCEISEMGGNKNWAAEIAGQAVGVGLAVATGGRTSGCRSCRGCRWWTWWDFTRYARGHSRLPRRNFWFGLVSREYWDKHGIIQF